MLLQHESASRSVDDNVWEELRNFKKCLIKMFQEQKKEVLFIETVTNLAKQQRHCLIECIPLPSDAAEEAPIYFKQVSYFVTSFLGYLCFSFIYDVTPISAQFTSFLLICFLRKLVPSALQG